MKKIFLVCLFIFAMLPMTASHASDGDFVQLGPYHVGHTSFTTDYVGISGELRPLNVHIWYPAGPNAIGEPTVYSSRLRGVPLIPGVADAISFEIPSTIALEDIPVSSQGPFSMLIFSHGSGNDAQNYAILTENLASHGFIVVTPNHTGNTTDDVIVDTINSTVGFELLTCLDGLPSPCQDSPSLILQNRASDVSFLIDYMESLSESGSGSLFENAVDVENVGLMGHSVGGITCLIAAGGSETLGIASDSRVKAIMPMASGIDPVTPEDLEGISIPTLLMVGSLDGAAPPELSLNILNGISTSPRTLVIVTGAHHRSFNSIFCDYLQATASVAVSSPTALVEFEIASQLLLEGMPGSALDYCPYDTYVTPVNITSFVEWLTGFVVTPDNVPRELELSTATHLTSLYAVSFFKYNLEGLNFYRRYLMPNYARNNEPEAVATRCFDTPAGTFCWDGETHDVP